MRERCWAHLGSQLVALHLSRPPQPRREAPPAPPLSARIPARVSLSLGFPLARCVSGALLLYGLGGGTVGLNFPPWRGVVLRSRRPPPPWGL